MSTHYYMTTKEVAKTFRLAVGTLANWRVRRHRGEVVGPDYITTPTGRILYRSTDVERWLTSGQAVAA